MGRAAAVGSKERAPLNVDVITLLLLKGILSGMMAQHACRILERSCVQGWQVRVESEQGSVFTSCTVPTSSAQCQLQVNFRKGSRYSFWGGEGWKIHRGGDGIRTVRERRAAPWRRGEVPTLRGSGDGSSGNAATLKHRPWSEHPSLSMVLGERLPEQLCIWRTNVAR